MPDKRKAYVFDMDGVIADISHREHWIEDGVEPDWNAFFDPDEMIKDAPIKPTLALMHGLVRQPNVWVLICTARPERTRSVTLKWLADEWVPYNKLITRPDGDHRLHRAAQWKQHTLAHLQDEFDILGFFDDHPGNVKAVAELGIPSVLYDYNATLRPRGGPH